MDKHIVIIGNGISGIIAARHIRKMSGHRITVISSESEHFISRTALMYAYMGHILPEHLKPYEDWFWSKNRIELLKDHVEKVEADAKRLLLKSGQAISYDILIIATGSISNKFGWPGQDLTGAQGLYSMQDLESMQMHTRDVKQAVIVGGGLIGIEMAEMLRSRSIETTFLVRENSFWNNVLPPEESEMINVHIRKHYIDLRLETELKEIIGDDKGCVKAVRTGSGEVIPCQFVGLTVGVAPNTGFLRDSGIEINKGVLVNEFLETNLDNVYAIGDCAEFRTPLPGRRPIEQVWYTGRIMGETLAYSICRERTAYQPGVWFNSAKFLDIEYQTYGWIRSQLSEGENTFFWKHRHENKCIRINYSSADHSILGIHSFGMRLRHEVCERWIREKKTVEEILEKLQKANFDPEFYKRHEKEIRQEAIAIQKINSLSR